MIRRLALAVTGRHTQDMKPSDGQAVPSAIDANWLGEPDASLFV
jgi:hypothetical protein